MLRIYVKNKKAVLSQGEPRDATVNLDMLMASCGFSTTARLTFVLYIRDRSDAEIIHGRDAKSLHKTKIAVKSW